MSGGYDHPLAGRRVTITREGPHHGRTFTVRRVVGSRFGGLAIDDAEPTTAWSVADVEVEGCVRCGTVDTGRFEQYGEVAEVNALLSIIRGPLCIECADVVEPCADCGRQVSYDYGRECYVHFEDPEVGCFLHAGSKECPTCKGSGTVGKPGFLTPCDAVGDDDGGEWYCDEGAIGRHDERVENGN